MNFSSSPEFWVKIWLLISIPKFYRSLLSKSLGSNVMSMQEMGHIVTLDLTGLKCPLPVLKARRQLGLMRSGAELVVLADDPRRLLILSIFVAPTGTSSLKAKPVITFSPYGFLYLGADNRVLKASTYLSV